MSIIKKGSVLVTVSEYGEFGFLFSLCKTIESELALHPVIVFSPGYGLLKDHSMLVENEGWSWAQLGSNNKSFHSEMDERSGNQYFRISPEAAGSQLAVNMRGIRIVLLFLLFLLSKITKKKKFKKQNSNSGGLFIHKEIKRQLQQAENIFNNVKPRLILSGQDYALSVTSIFSLIGEKRGIKTVIVPFSMPPTTREIVESFAYNDYNQLKGIEKRLFSELSPNWLNVRRGKVYSRVNPMAAIAADRFKLTPPNPWLPNSGRGIVFCPSQWAYDYYLKAGIPQAQLRMTGAAWGDKLLKSSISIEERRQKLIQSSRRALRNKKIYRNIDSAQLSGNFYGGLENCDTRNADKLVIVSWPPNQYPRKAIGCVTYEDLCAQFLNALADLQTEENVWIVVSLHPTLTDPKLLEGIQKEGIYVLRSNLIESVDCADVYVSTVSSTSFWALQCGIPTLNFDGYMYGYTEFDSAGAVTIKTPIEIADECKKLFGDQHYYIKTQNQIKEKSKQFLMADGLSMKRILDDMSELTLQPPMPTENCVADA